MENPSDKLGALHQNNSDFNDKVEIFKLICSEALTFDIEALLTQLLEKNKFNSDSLYGFTGVITEANIINYYEVQDVYDTYGEELSIEDLGVFHTLRYLPRDYLTFLHTVHALSSNVSKHPLHHQLLHLPHESRDAALAEFFYITSPITAWLHGNLFQLREILQENIIQNTDGSTTVYLPFGAKRERQTGYTYNPTTHSSHALSSQQTSALEEILPGQMTIDVFSTNPLAKEMLFGFAYQEGTAYLKQISLETFGRVEYKIDEKQMKACLEILNTSESIQESFQMLDSAFVRANTLSQSHAYNALFLAIQERLNKSFDGVGSEPEGAVHHTIEALLDIDSGAYDYSGFLIYQNPAIISHLNSLIKTYSHGSPTLIGISYSEKDKAIEIGIDKLTHHWDGDDTGITLDMFGYKGKIFPFKHFIPFLGIEDGKFMIEHEGGISGFTPEDIIQLFDVLYIIEKQ